MLAFVTSLRSVSSLSDLVLRIVVGILMLPASQLCCEQVGLLFMVVSVCVRLSAQNLENYCSEIDVTW